MARGRGDGQPRGSHRPRRPRGVRLRGPAARPARGDRVRARGPRHAGRDVDRLGQVGDLPDRRAADRGRDGRRLAADRAPARPGRGPRRARDGRRRAAELEPAGVGARARARRAGGEHARVPVPGTRAAGQRGGAGRAVGGAALAARGRRGALHLRVGPRLPARVPADRRRRRGARAPDDPRPHRHGGAARARGDRRAARPARPGGARARLRPAQHPPRGRALPRRAGRRAQAARAAGRRRGGAQAGHRLRRHPPPRRGAGGVAVRARRARPPPTTPACAGTSAMQVQERVHGLGARGRGRHHRVRHGDRQGGRALGLPQRGLRVARRLLPGDRPRRARRRARAGPALLPQRGPRAAALLLRRRARRGRRDRAGARRGRRRRHRPRRRSRTRPSCRRRSWRARSRGSRRPARCDVLPSGAVEPQPPTTRRPRCARRPRRRRSGACSTARAWT